MRKDQDRGIRHKAGAQGTGQERAEYGAQGTGHRTSVWVDRVEGLRQAGKQAGRLVVGTIRKQRLITACSVGKGRRDREPKQSKAKRHERAVKRSWVASDCGQEACRLVAIKVP